MRDVALALLLVLGGGEVAIASAASEQARESLRGFSGVEVVVEDMKPDAFADGLTPDVIQPAVELVLRTNGVRVLAETEGERMPSMPYLYLHVSTTQLNSGSYVFGVVLEWKQVVKLLSRGEKGRVIASTWAVREIGYAPRDQLHRIISEVVEPMVKRFATDFVAMNPH